ncbi:MAG: cryptochrome/photolyase family protein [Gemmatimonadetes bacterium]|nr:cryptochrome/photolyase family protein [Gemmatimonadota bacterium]NNL31006.1 cryptochrome/photolyase family protein [Gemmatimonadota bacterium]
MLVLGDQLNRSVEPLVSAVPESSRVLMIESAALAGALPHHKQKLVLVFSAMRHFARELEADGFEVDYRQCEDFEDGVVEYLSDYDGATLEVMRPTDWGYEERLREAADAAGGSLEVVDNGLWLTADEDFDSWAEDRKSLRLEYFYREERKRRGWLMEGDEPAGGEWNYDKKNRETPDDGHDFPDPPRFEPDELTQSVMEEVEERFPDHFGDLEDFAWPVTRDDALEALNDFVENRLAGFGPYEDAIVDEEPILYHSLLSVPLNLGLLTAEDVCERALERWREGDDVPIQSIEGFIRQILGWREFMRHIYRMKMPEIREANGLGHDLSLPGAYWGGKTDMRCIQRSVGQLQRTGHTHHIQRLMILGNFALIARVDPRELNEWFLGCYVDALDWVVTPNVMGMSQFADLGSFTSKPYAASANYVNKMSDYCGECRYDPKQSVGADACPLNSLYWAFIDHHAERWSSNHRMALMLRNWERREEEDRSEILAKAETVREALADGGV